MGLGVLSILSVILSFIILAIIVLRKGPIFLGILSAAFIVIILNFVFYRNFPIETILDKAFLDYKNLRTLAIILFMLTLTGVISSTKLNKILEESARNAFSDRRHIIVLIPSIIGLIPMPAGALVSAILVKNSLNPKNTPPEILTASNYWFRHVWEYFWIFYQAVIYEQVLVDLSLTKIMLLQAPFALTGILLGIFYFYPKLKEFKRNNKRRDIRSFVKILYSGWPIFLTVSIVLAFTLISSIFSLKISAPDVLVATLPIVIVFTILIHRPSKNDLKENLKKSMKPPLIAAILAAFFYRATIETYNIAEGFTTYLSSLGFPIITLIAILPFAIGLLTGISFAYVTVAFPILLPIITNAPAVYAPMAYAFGHFGMMLSPAHFCLIFSNEFFESKLHKTYKHVFIIAGANTILATLISLLYFKIY
ncbi:MAG TPA: DUF401 family protein [Euryarchaeota archaeon]|nr:DUF401 family protein [Euryarchaeota archaeon]